jgi:hypothetical protein
MPGALHADLTAAVPSQDRKNFFFRPWCVLVPRLVDDVLPEVVHNAP